MEKTEWADTQVIFLGMLLDGTNHTLSIDENRRLLVLDLIQVYMDKKKATVKQLQQLAGHLNFLNRAIVPG